MNIVLVMQISGFIVVYSLMRYSIFHSCPQVNLG